MLLITVEHITFWYHNFGLSILDAQAWRISNQLIIIYSNISVSLASIFLDRNDAGEPFPLFAQYLGFWACKHEYVSKVT